MTQRNTENGFLPLTEREQYLAATIIDIALYKSLLTNKRLGYILNFHVPLMKNGIKSIIL